MTVEASRGRVADAALRLAGTVGLDGVTFSRVASEAGVSRGLVQHVAGSRAQLLRLAAKHLRHRVDERLADHLGAVSTAPARLEVLLGALIPRNDDEIDEAYAAASLLVLTRHDSELAEAFRTGRHMLFEAVRDCLPSRGSPTGATALLGIAGDLRQAVMLGAETPGSAQDALRRAIAGVAGPRDPHPTT